MKISKASCHICLCDKIYVVGNDRSKCQNNNCHGYICNICWTDLVSNDFKSCPICRFDLDEGYIDNRTKNKLSIYMLLLHIISVIIGFITITGIYLIWGHNLNDYARSIHDFTFLEIMAYMVLVDIVGMIWMCLIIIPLYIRYSKK